MAISKSFFVITGHVNNPQPANKLADDFNVQTTYVLQSYVNHF